MVRVDRPGFEPFVCAVSLRGDDSEFFIDTGVDLRGLDPRVSVSAAGLRMLLQAADWPTPQDHAALRVERDELAARVAELEAEHDGLVEQVAAVTVLRAAGLDTKRPAGRPKSKPAEKAGA